MADLKIPGLGFRAMGGAVKADAVVASLSDADEAYLAYDSGNAILGVKGNGAGQSRGVKVRTLNAGVTVDAVSYAPDGTPTFANNPTVPSSYKINGIIALSQVTNYMVLHDGSSAGGAVTVGNATDPTSYYDNTTHTFRTRSGGATIALLSALGFVLGTDPGGAQLLRVGGGANFAGPITPAAPTNGASLDNSTNTFSLVDGSAQSLVAQNYGLVLIRDSAGSTALIGVWNGTNTQVIWQNAAEFSNTVNNAGTMNVYITGGAMTVQNKTGASKTIAVMTFKL